jgi:hypothetical protein
MISLLHQLVQRHCIFFKPADKPAERGEANSKLLRVFEFGGWL